MAATMWPFNPAPRNTVSWLVQRNGIHFGKHGFLRSAEDFPVTGPPQRRFCSMEILLQADNTTDVRTLLGFYGAKGPAQFTLRQYGAGLIILRRTEDSRRGAAKIDVDHVFDRGGPVLITISSGAHGTNVYLNGELSQAEPGYFLTEHNFSGQLILGTSATNYEPWSGALSGLAFYENELDAAHAREHYAEWIKTGNLSPDRTEHPIAIYPFDERGGSVIHNAAGVQPALLIPPSFQITRKPMLLPPWREITPLGTYTADIIRNIVGFVPLGAALYLYFSRLFVKRVTIPLAIALGFTTSLTIEILQAFIPQRSSGMTDIITNTLGTCLGVFLLQPRAIKVILERLGILSVPPEMAIAADKQSSMRSID